MASSTTSPADPPPVSTSPEPFRQGASSPNSAVTPATPAKKRPPPFTRKLNRKLFIRPAHLRGEAPSYVESLKSALTYSYVNVLLVFNPIAWALHYTNQNDGAVFATALLGVMPLAGMLGHGTETIAMYTGDALGGLINASLGNATEFIIAILLLIKCEIRVVQASLLGGLLSNLLLVTGMAFLVGGFRFSEMEFQQTAAQLNTSLMTLAVIALVLPTAFAIAIEQASGEDQERELILEMSRGSAVILILIYILHLIFQLYSHSHLYNPDAEIEYRTPSNSSASLPSQIEEEQAEPQVQAPSSSTAKAKAEEAGIRDHPHAHTERRLQPPAVGGQHLRPAQPRRASSLPFGSAAALGRGNRLPIQHGHMQMHAKVREKSDELRAIHERRKKPAPDVERAGPRGDVGAGDESDDEEEKETPAMNLPVALGALVAATGLTYLTAEALTDALESIGQSSNVSTEWLGLILLAIVGNAAEHITAVFVAYRNKVDLALAVSVGSCIQIALFVIPVLVLIGWIANFPLSLLFDPLEVVTLFLSVLLVRFATEDGRTHYMSGVTLFGSYVLIALAFWYYPLGGTSTGRLFDQC